MISFDDRISAKFDMVERGPEDMHAYQNEGFEFLRDNPFSHIFVDLGLGKTVTSLTLIAWLVERCFLTNDKILVVGPVRVMTDTWPTEIGLWAHTAHLTYSLIREDEDDPRLRAARAIDRAENPDRSWKRDMMVANGADDAEVLKALGPTNETRMRITIRKELAVSSKSIHFINKEQLEWLVNFHRHRWPYRTVIIDEVSLFKDHKTHVFKALAKVRNTPGLITRLHGLTATPAAETYEHLWALMYLVDAGKRLGKNITKYRNDYFIQNRWSRKLTLRDGGEEMVLDKIKDVCLVMKAKDYLDLEEPKIYRRPIILPESVKTIYKTMADDMVVKIGDATIEAETAAALSAKLLQIASGVLYETQLLGDWETEDMKKVTKVHPIHNLKIDALREIVESLDGEPVLVAYHFKSSLDRLKKAFPKATVMDPEGKCVKAWRARKIPILLIHPKSGGHGLNLQAGGHNIVFYDLVWSLELYLQLIGRLARQGQTNPVVVQLLTAVGTLDDAVCDALTLKEDAQDRLFSILKRMILNMKKGKKITSA